MIGSQKVDLQDENVSESASELDGDQESAKNGDENQRKQPGNPFIRILRKVTKKNNPERKKNVTIEMLQPSRYKPSDLNQMAEDTKFSKSEVRCLYRAFKQECPNGIVDEETFKEVYEKIFPLGDATHYAHLVFAAIDKEKTGGITFGDFMEFLSVISKGTTQDKLSWAFTFYDVDHDSVISKEDMLRVTDSIHELMGNTSAVGSKSSQAHITRIFETMDQNQDGKVTFEEFVTYCTTQKDVRQSLMLWCDLS